MRFVRYLNGRSVVIANCNSRSSDTSALQSIECQRQEGCGNLNYPVPLCAGRSASACGQGGTLLRARRDSSRALDCNPEPNERTLAINGEQLALQPAHWILEVGAVLARESPATAVDDIDMLAALELPTTDDLPALQRGVQLALEIKQHLFDTYYHGVALASLQPTSATCAQHAPRLHR
jgi:hypothetical protein